ncbi:MAG: PEP-CTERM sorting domain-containing protein [Rhizobacter sp.]|nr:PEP-CTERM sorting domain-containing protein [Rhizobacter sp.]
MPEPETCALMAAGLALMAVQARRRTRRVAWLPEIAA